MLHPPSLTLLKCFLLLHFHWSWLLSPDGVSGAPAAFSFKEEKVQRNWKNNLYHFWLNDISPCSCHSPCLLSWCYCKQSRMGLHLQSPDWFEMAERRGIEACSDVMLVCTSFETLFCMFLLCKWSNSFSCFSLLFLSLFLLWCWVQAECPCLGYSTCESCSSFPMAHRSHPPFYWALYGHKWRDSLSSRDVTVLV